MFLLLLLLVPSVVMGSPQAYLTEDVSATFSDSTLVSSAREGYVEVYVDNQEDVLQFVRITLSGTDNTNLISNETYRAVAASPVPGSRTRMYVDTTSGYGLLSYEIDENVAPLIEMALDYSNLDGGKDLHSGTNTLFFNLTLNATGLSNVNLTVQAKRNNFGDNDSADLFNPHSPYFTPTLVDSDGDGFNDRIIGSGISGYVWIGFYANITSGINYDDTGLVAELDEGGTVSEYSQSSTFSGVSIIDRFARGPVREGIDMVKRGTWLVRGFLKNTARYLTYIVHGWELYRVGDNTPVLSSTQETTLAPGETLQTSQYDTGSSEKPDYYSPSFDWEVVWGPSFTTARSRSTLLMPELKQMDIFADKTASLESNSESGTVLKIEDKVVHLGHINLSVDAVNIYSVIPRLSQSGSQNSWSVSNIGVFFNNGSSYDITSFALIDAVNAGPLDGYVNVTVDLGDALGGVMEQNDFLIVNYTLTGSSKSSSESYFFSQTSKVWTETGTPETETASYTLTVPGTGAPSEEAPTAGGGGGGAAPAYSDIVKENVDAYLTAANTVSVEAIGRIIDTGRRGVKEIKFYLYIPGDGRVLEDSVALEIYSSTTSSWTELAKDRDYVVVDRGFVSIGGERYHEYLVDKYVPPGGVYGDGIHLYDGDMIRIRFRAEIPYGTNYIITRMMGYNFYEDKIMFEDMYTPIRRPYGRLEVFEIREGEWEQGRAVVGRPVKWIKRIWVHNPNEVSMEDVLDFDVPGDSLSVRWIEVGGTQTSTSLEMKKGNITYVSIPLQLGPNEEREFILEIQTPPALETKRRLDILESNGTAVVFLLNLTVENFGSMEYRNLYYEFEDEKRILEVYVNGNPLKVGSGKEVLIGDIDGGERLNLVIKYLETPPVMIVSLNSLEYGCDDRVEITVFIVPSGNESGSYVEVEVYNAENPSETAYLDLIEIGNIGEGESVKITRVFDIGSMPSGRYVVLARFRKEFTTILSDRKEMFVNCEKTALVIGYLPLLLILVVVVLILLVFRRYRRRRFEDEIERLKKEIERLK